MSSSSNNSVNGIMSSLIQCNEKSRGYEPKLLNMQNDTATRQLNGNPETGNFTSNNFVNGLMDSPIQFNDECSSNLVDSINEHELLMRQPERTPEKAPPSRWRQRYTENHKKEKNKRRRNAGRPNEKVNGDFVPPRTIGNACKCNKKCRSLLQGKELQLFHSFWDLGSYDKQNVYLGSRIHVEQVKRHYKSRSKDITKSPKRKVSYKYSVNIMGRQVFICKVEFLAVHGLQFSVKRVEILSRKLKNGMLIPKSDGRGKHQNHPKYDISSLNMVREHINIIPKYASHYSREMNPHKVYLDYDMTISDLYRKYCEWIDEKNEGICEDEHGVSGIGALSPTQGPKAHGTSVVDASGVGGFKLSNAPPKYEVVSEDKYRRIFSTEYNIGFKLPRSDTCKTCDALNTKINANVDDADLVAKLKIELECHQNEAQQMQDDLNESIKNAKESNLIDVFIFDLMQALMTPQLTVGIAFYLRKALVYNFGIHNGKTDKGFMFLWPENVAGRGSDEVASCIWKYLEINKPSADHLIVYSDNCGGQNKNWNLMAFWRQLVLDGVYKSIEHRFLIPGHTRLPCDRDFALIENQKKRHGQVYSPSDWCQIIKDSNGKNEFVVTEMKNEDFYSFEEVLRTIVKKTTMDAQIPLHFRESRCFLFQSEHADIMFVRHNIDGPFLTVTIERRKLQSTFSKTKDLISKKYDGFLSLTHKKLKDLRKLMPYIPPNHRSFYEKIFLDQAFTVEEGQEDKDDEDIQNDFEMII